MIPALLRRAGLVVTAALVALLALAGPAFAHGADAPDATDYRAEVTGLTPVRSGLNVRTVEAGARLPLRGGDATVEVRGTLDWMPPPDAYPWWVATTLGFLAIGAAGLAPTGSRALRGVGVLLALGGATAVAFTVGRELDAGAEGLGGALLGLVSGQTWALLTGLGAIAAGGYALARREAADFALALAGACLALFAGSPTSRSCPARSSRCPGPPRRPG